jgi:hypothetical protein
MRAAYSQVLQDVLRRVDKTHLGINEGIKPTLAFESRKSLARQKMRVPLLWT